MNRKNIVEILECLSNAKKEKLIGKFALSFSLHEAKRKLESYPFQDVLKRGMKKLLEKVKREVPQALPPKSANSLEDAFTLEDNDLYLWFNYPNKSTGLRILELK